MPEAPRYRHNCPRCSYLGCLLVGESWWDIFSCCGGASIVFRWGPNGDDYYAGLIEHFPLRSFRAVNRQSDGPQARVLNEVMQAVKKNGWLP